MAIVGDRIRQFARDVRRDIETVARDSLKDVVVLASTPVAEGGRMPVDTGALRDSVCVTTNNGSISGVDAVGFAIDAADIGAEITIAWGVPYAAPVEFGRDGSAGRAFARSAVVQYPTIVAQNAARVR